ncbi:hypothetical protein HOLleu_33631 [Holothuria leucospilota]|uniref:FAM124 domain-containing protein n=1 Tax=Holothuria leucospilota TaxID=206669 RepID=A0A9Q1BGS0_HOLLE|nr:hypothetical protein HOLleu_33631 [Holothuria leucospilota]
MSYECVVSVSTSSPDLTLVGKEPGLNTDKDCLDLDGWNKELAKFSVCDDGHNLSIPELPRPNSAPGERLLKESEGDEDFTFQDILYIDEKEEQIGGLQGNFPTREGYYEFSETPPINVQSISDPAGFSKPCKDRQCQNSSHGELYRNVLNQVHQQVTHNVVRSSTNTLFRPVIPVINEDSGEEHASLTEEVGSKHSLRSGRPTYHSTVRTHLSNQRTMNGQPKKKSSVSVSEISSTDDDSYSSEEDTANFREYRKQNLSPKPAQQRRHSIASSSVDHLAQILSFLQKTSTGNSSVDVEGKSNVDSTSTTSFVQPQDSYLEKHHTLEWIRESDFGSHRQVDERPNSEYRVQAKDGSHGIPKPGKPKRRFSVDISNLPNIGPAIEDPSFAREILHQKIIQLASSQDSINEKDESEDISSKSSDISEQRTRRLSLGNLAATGIQTRRVVKKYSEPLMGSGSKRCTYLESERIPGKEDYNDTSEMIRLSSRMRQRRSSWACAGAHSYEQKVLGATLLNDSRFSENPEEEERSDVKDPYRLTLHFISDPKQSKKLKTLLRPLTHSVAPKLKLFNYADRSERLVVDNKEPDVMAIPALAIMAFLQEEQGIERILKAQQYLKEEPWQLHHKDTVGGNVVPYPTNNQDFYSHADGMPLWAVRQMHMGKDRLRFMLFVSHDNWDDTVSFYSKILSRTVQFQKEDFCYFLVFCCKKLNLEVQLALKRLPIGFVPAPLDAAILQFKVKDIGQLVPLMPRVCSPISATRWQTTDLDGNKILLLVHHDNTTENTGIQTPRSEHEFESSGKSSPQSDGEIGIIDKNHNYNHLINYV